MTTTISDYLANIQAKLTNNRTKTIVLGNEAADLDSMASSLAYSYLLSKQNHNSDHNIIPVLPIPRADFKLRTEAVYVFKKAKIDISQLVFIDELNMAATLANNGKLILVDHNKLAASLPYDHQVTAIIDHHFDENHYPNITSKIIEMVGSTASLITLEINKNHSHLLDQRLATLLMATILLDTVNLSPKAQRVTPIDTQAANILLAKWPINQELLFSKTLEAKFNINALSSYDLLRKDYKQWQLGPINCGIASVPLPISSWRANDPEFVRAFVGFAKKHNLALLVAMNAFLAPDFQRNLIIFSTTDKILLDLEKELQEKDLQLTAFPATTKQPGIGKISFFKQGNIKISRKKLHPLLANHFKSQP